MWKPTLASFMFICALVISPVQAGYDRNQAVPVEKSPLWRYQLSTQYHRNPIN